jgi:hypothetical protein
MRTALLCVLVGCVMCSGQRCFAPPGFDLDNMFDDTPTGWLRGGSNRNSWYQHDRCKLNANRTGATIAFPGMGPGYSPPFRPSQLGSGPPPSASGVPPVHEPPSLWLPEWLPAFATPLVEAAQNLFFLALQYVPEGLGRENLLRTYTTASGHGRLFHRVRFDVFAPKLPAAGTSQLLDFFTYAPGLIPGWEGAALHDRCQHTFNDPVLLGHLNPSAVDCVAHEKLHPAEHLLDFVAFTADALHTGLRALAGHDTVDDTTFRSAVSHSPPSEPPLDTLPYPVCSFDLPALAAEACLRLQCSNSMSCVTLQPDVIIIASRRVDTALLTMISAAFVLYLVRPLVARSRVVQLLLAATLGSLIVLIVAAYLVLNTITDTRLGKLGAYSVFALGGFAALARGATSSLWYWFASEFAHNRIMQAAVLTSSIVSTALCYYKLGQRLVGILSLTVRALTVALVLASIIRNPEATVAIFGSIGLIRLAMWAFQLLLRRFQQQRLVARSPTAAPRTHHEAGDAAASSDGDGEGAEQRESPRAGGWVWNDPVDEERLAREMSKHRRMASLPVRRLPGESTTARQRAYEEQGDAFTRRELRKLGEEVRRRPEHWAAKVHSPNAVLRFFGAAPGDVEDVDSDGDD